MDKLIEYSREYWPYLIALVVASIAAAFVVKKAVRAYRNYYKRYRSEESRMKRLVSLKEKYMNITPEEIATADEADMLEGVALAIQLRLQKKDDMEKEFALCSVEKQYAYALDIFVQSSSPSSFFRENGVELTGIIVDALAFIGLDEPAIEAEKLRRMFDEDEEDVSIDSLVIDEVDAYFKSNAVSERIKSAAAEKIKSCPEPFLFLQ